MKKSYILFLLIFGSFGVWGQTVFTDDFNRATVSPGGTPSMTYTNTMVGTSTASITSNALRIANGTTSGLSYVTGSTSTYSAPYSTTLNLNPSLVTWTFNFRYERTAGLPGGVASGSYGTAIVLAGSSSTLTTGTGYAIAYGNGGSPDPIRLVAYSSGIATSTNIISSGVADISAATNYVSVRVTYNPTTNGWSLYLRDDGATAWADPSTGVTNQIGSTTVNSTYTSTPLTAFGFIWSHANTVAAANASSFDNYTVSLAPTGTPTINVTPSSLTGFSSTSGVPSAEQTYLVDGSNLTTDIVITPPAGFQISLSTGPFVPTNPINLTPVAGTVSSTTIYVRMNSATVGPNTGNITHTSTGATQKDVAVSGNVLATEPTVQSSITIGAVTNSTIVVNFGGGNGARRILLARLASAVNSDPVDGTTYTANANFASGSQIGTGNYVVYDGTGNTQLVTGLTAGATYHFAIYEYNNGGVAGAENYLVPGGVGNATVATYSVPYVWIGLNGDWQVPVNWAPPRLFPATNDSLLFISALTDTITNVPTQTVGYIGASLFTNTTLQAATSGNVLTIGGLTGTDFYVEAGSAFNIASSNALTLNLPTGSTASINGSMRFTAGGHRLTAADPSGVIFNSGSVFTAGTGFSGNAFGATGTANSIVFGSGSRYEQIAGSNPFALGQPASLVVFNSGSLFKLLANLTPSVSGRTYANFELDFPAAVISATGSALLSMDTVTVTNGSISFGMTTAGMNVKGNINVAAGATLNFAPASAAMLNLNGTALQNISHAGTLSFSANQNVTVNNAAGVTLNSPVTLLGALTLTSGIVNTTAANLLTMGAASSVAGASNASYVNGPVKKIGNTAFTFPVGKANGYVPIRVSNFTGASAATDEFTAEYIRASAYTLGPENAPFITRVSACEYWTLNLNNGTPTANVTLFWSPNNNCNGAYITDLAQLEIACFDNGAMEWNSSSTGFSSTTGTTTTGDITWTGGISTFGPFTLASKSGDNPLPIVINYFNGTKQNANHLLNWKVTCVSSPSVTMELERSTDGRNYNSIYSVFATAVRCQQPFDYMDNDPAKGVNYYRIKMTDADGKITYSSIVSLINATKGMDIMNISPNPIVNGAFNLKLSSAEKTAMELVVVDMQGRVMMKQSTNIIAGFNVIPVNVKQLSAGTYQLFGNTSEGRTRVLRFVIQ